MQPSGRHVRSFYHYFTGWAAYTRELISTGGRDRTVRIIDVIRAQPDPRKRIESIIEVALSLPTAPRAAIRSWARWTGGARTTEVDQQRFGSPTNRRSRSSTTKPRHWPTPTWPPYLFLGYEQTTLPRELRMFEWMCNTMLDDLEAGRFADVPPP